MRFPDSGMPLWIKKSEDLIVLRNVRFVITETNFGGTTSADKGKSVAVDSLGNVFLIGWTNGGLDGNTNSNTNCTDSTSTSCYDIFLTKFNNAGDKLWTKQWGTSDSGSSIAINSSENIFITGNIGGVVDIFLTKFEGE